MTKTPDLQPHRLYTVTFRSLRGETQSHQALTNRGEAKAVHLASLGARGLHRFTALDVEVRDDGPVEVDGDEVAVLHGFAFDRNEW